MEDQTTSQVEKDYEALLEQAKGLPGIQAMQAAMEITRVSAEAISHFSGSTGVRVIGSTGSAPFRLVSN